MAPDLALGAAGFRVAFFATGRLAATFFLEGAFFFGGDFLIEAFLATFFFEVTFFFAGAFLATFFLLTFLAAVFFFVTFFFTAFFLVEDFFLLAAFFAGEAFFFTTLRFFDADFFDVDFLATTFFLEVVVFLRCLLAAFFAGMCGLLPDREKAGIIHGLRGDGSPNYAEFQGFLALFEFGRNFARGAGIQTMSKNLAFGRICAVEIGYKPRMAGH